MAFKIKEFLAGTGLIVAGLVTGQGWLVAIGLGFWQSTIPGPDIRQRQDGILHQGISTESPVPIVYGTARVAPRIVWADTYGIEGFEGSNLLCDLVACFCLGNRVPQEGEEADPFNGEIEGFGSVFWDDLLAFDADAPVADPEDVPGQPDPVADNTMTGYFLVTEANRHFGAHDQVADAFMLEVNGVTRPSGYEGGVPTDFPWTEDHRLQGIAYMVIRLGFHEAYAGGAIPNMSCVLKARRLYDPRLASSSGSSGPSVAWAWSNNWALCVRDYLLDQRSGGALLLAEIDEQSFIDEADVSDELVEDPTGACASLPRYLLDGVIATEQGVLQNIQEMLAVAGGLLCYEAGVFHLRRLDPESTIHTLELNESNLIGSWDLQTSDPGERINRMTVKHVDGSEYNAAAPRDQIESVQVPPLGETNTYLEEDGGYEVPREMQLRLVRDRAHAYIRGDEELGKSRSDLAVTVLGMEETWQLAVADRVLMSHQDFTMVDKEFWVVAVAANFDDTVSLGLRAIGRGQGLPIFAGGSPNPLLSFETFCEIEHGAHDDPPDTSSSLATGVYVSWGTAPPDTAARFDYKIRIASGECENFDPLNASPGPGYDCGVETSILLDHDTPNTPWRDAHGGVTFGNVCHIMQCGSTGDNPAGSLTRWYVARWEYSTPGGGTGVGPWSTPVEVSTEGWSENPAWASNPNYCL